MRLLSRLEDERKFGAIWYKISRQSPKPFTTKRLLVGQFQDAESLLRKGVRELTKGGLFLGRPVIVIHPIEMVEGGFSEVEERVYRELGEGVGARRVVVHAGAPLADAEVVAAAQNKT